MREQGYKAILIVAGVFVAAIFALGYINKPNLSNLMARADSSLHVSPRYFGDSTHDGRSPKKFPPRKSKRTLSIELNTADSATLCRVYGIGATFSHRIINRRKALGGYYCVEQLREVRGIDEEAYERIAKKFFVDTVHIIKININFADRKTLTSHPYISQSMARRIERARMEGGYITSEEELTKRNILLPNETRKVAHYLSFNLIVKP